MRKEEEKRVQIPTAYLSAAYSQDRREWEVQVVVGSPENTAVLLSIPGSWVTMFRPIAEGLSIWKIAKNLGKAKSYVSQQLNLMFDHFKIERGEEAEEKLAELSKILLELGIEDILPNNL